MSSAVNVFVHAIRKRSKKCLAQKVGNLGSLGPIPMIQPPFNSTCVALQYEPGTKFFHRAVPELHGHKKSEISVQLRGISVRIEEVAKEYSHNLRENIEQMSVLCVYSRF